MSLPFNYIYNRNTYREKCIALKTRVSFFFKIFVRNIFSFAAHLAIYTRTTCIIAENFSSKCVMCSGFDSASNRNEYQEYFLGVEAAGA